MQAPNLKVTDPNPEKLEQLARLGWYHSMELPDGSIIPGFQSVEQLRRRVAQFPIPDDLRGKRVLDIGAWDGWFSFEMERRGAGVVAVDSTVFERFRVARELLASKVEYHIGDVCRLSPARIGYFDIVLFLGVLYHLKHPLLALEKVCELSTDMVCVESFVTDDGSDLTAKPVMEFYETTELCGQFDNWVGPNSACLLAMCRAAGFATVRLESVLENRAHVTCYRHWPEVAEVTEPAPHITAVENAITHDREFASDSDDYVSLWFTSPREGLTRADVFPRIGSYGVYPAFVHNTGGIGWQVNCKCPPGLPPGMHEVALRTTNSPWSNRAHIAVDASLRMPQTSVAGGMVITTVTDGKTWERNLVHSGLGSCISVWIAGLPEDASEAEIAVWLGGNDLPAIFLSPPDPQGLRQINALLPSAARLGDYEVTVSFRGAMPEPVAVRLV